MNDDNTYNCDIKISLDDVTGSKNTIYSNGNNEIHVVVSYTIYPQNGDSSNSDPNQGTATVSLLNYNTAAKLIKMDPSTVTENTAKGWKYWTEGNSYVNPFPQPPGPDATESIEPVRAPAHFSRKDGDLQYIVKDFYFYNDSGNNDSLSVAVGIDWKDATGKNHHWDTTIYNDAADVTIYTIIPKVYGSKNTNGEKLDYQDYPAARLKSGRPYYQRSYFFKITDSSKIVKADIVHNIEQSAFMMNQDQSNQELRYYFYLWKFNDTLRGYSKIFPFDVSIMHSERQNNICLTRIKVPDYNGNYTSPPLPPSITIYDDYGNSSKFIIQFNTNGDTPLLTSNNNS